MLCDLIVIYDHLYQNIKVVTHIFSPTASTDLANLSFIYSTAVAKLRRVAKTLISGAIPTVVQPPVTLGSTATSNVGKEGYEEFVTKLKKNIIAGDIIQAVPSQRLSRPTALHPFNAYRQLRQVNPSPYMYYLDCGDFQIVGASPETLCKVAQNKVYNHAIAGTTKRGKTATGWPLN
jgi:anthranilate synthase component 1